MLRVQIFGVKNSQATRAAERFFKERRVAIQMVDLKQKPLAPGEIRRFIERFGLAGLLDSEGKAYIDAGLKYYKLSEAELLGRVERDPKLLRLPLIRAGKLVWQGDITALASDGAVVCNGQEFRALEPLFLHLTGERYTDLKWL
jgi:arsenate reductase-like glutaredoxin family protein